MSGKPKAIVLLSGGLDSTVALARALASGFACACVSADYGQRHAVELLAARAVAAHYGVPWSTVKIHAPFGEGPLTGGVDVPKGRTDEDRNAGVAPTYVPARNTLLLAFALVAAERAGARAIVVGANAADAVGYPDCRPEFFTAFERVANRGTRAAAAAAGAPYQVLTPLVQMDKAAIVREAVALGAPVHLTHSCYDPRGRDACGRCDACLVRRAGFAAAGVADPATYVAP